MSAIPLHDCSPLSLMKDVLNQVFHRQGEYGLPIADVDVAPSNLQRRGISFIIKLFVRINNRVRSVSVPISVHCEYTNNRKRALWQGKNVEPVTLKELKNWDEIFNDAVHQVVKCLKTAFNKILRKLRCMANRDNMRNGKTCSTRHFWNKRN